jgi:hypothetical protein
VVSEADNGTVETPEEGASERVKGTNESAQHIAAVNISPSLMLAARAPLLKLLSQGVTRAASATAGARMRGCGESDAMYLGRVNKVAKRNQRWVLNLRQGDGHWNTADVGYGG